MWILLRAGRNSARASVTRSGPPSQPHTWGWPARLIWMLIFGILLAHWWRFTVFFLLPLMVITIIVALCSVRGQAAKRTAADDALDRAMTDLRASKDAPR